MPVRLSETDRIEAAKAVAAVRRKDEIGFQGVVDSAVTRYGGLERLIRVLATEAGKSDDA